MPSGGPRPFYNSNNSSQVSPHPHEVAHVLNTITEILAVSEIIRRDEVYPICLLLRQLELLTFIPTLEGELMFTYRYIGQSI